MFMTDVIVEDGTIVANANSYATISGVDTYALDFAYADWTAATETVKKQSLFKGMRYIESLSFKGTQQTEDQALEFPRSDLYDRNSYLMDEDFIPSGLINATYEAAIASLPTTTTDLQPSKNSDDYRTKLDIAGAVTEEWYSRGRIKDRNTVITDFLRGYINSQYIVEIQRG